MACCKTRGYMIVLCGFLVEFLTYGVVQSVGLYTTALMETFETSAFGVSLVGSLNIGLHLGGGPLVVPLLKRFSYRKVALIGAVLSSVGLICAPFAPNIELMYLLYGIIPGLGSSMLSIIADVLCGLWFDERRSLMSGIIGAGSGAGGLIFPLFTHYFMQMYGWRGSMLITAAICMNTIVCAAIFITPKSETSEHMNCVKESHYEMEKMLNEDDNIAGDAAPQKAESVTANSVISDKNGVCNIFQNVKYDMFLLNVILVSMADSICLVFFPDYLVTKGLNEKQITITVIVADACVGIGSVVGGALGNIHCINRTILCSASSAVLGVPILLICFGFVDTFEGVIALNVSYGLCLGVWTGLQIVLVADIVGLERIEDGISYMMLISGIGYFIGAPISGLLRDHSGHHVDSFYLSSGLSFISGGVFVSSLFCKNQKQK